MKRTLTIIFTIFILQLPIFSQDWMTKIIPMKTAITETEQMFKEKPKKYEDFYDFQLKQGDLRIYFSLGNCKSGAYGGWNIPKGIVTHIRYYPEKERKLSFYRKNTQDMSLEYDSGQKVFTDEINGVSYWVQFENLRCS
jgi:hypothetical protein